MTPLVALMPPKVTCRRLASVSHARRFWLIQTAWLKQVQSPLLL